MSLLTKMLQAATQGPKRGLTADVEQRIKQALAPLADLGRGLGRGGPVTGLPTCLGAPAAFTDALAGQIRAARTHPGADEAMPSRVHAEPYGSRGYKLFVPNGDAAPKALVLMLHGCSQTAEDFAAGTRMNVLAQQAGVAVAYPEQPRSANVGACWNWFEPGHQVRGAGEPGILAGLARAVAAELAVPPSRVFAAGLSAGAAMAAILAEIAPDLFAAVGLHSGLPFGAASDIPSAMAVMRDGSGPGRSTPPGRAVPTIIFQGDADRTVNPRNADAIAARIAAREAGLRLQTERGSAGGRAYTRTTGRDAAGVVRVEDWRIAGAGHAWSGGSPTGSHTDAAGPDASAEMLRFFLATA